jgi:hypothetical protein
MRPVITVATKNAPMFFARKSKSPCGGEISLLLKNTTNNQLAKNKRVFTPLFERLASFSSGKSFMHLSRFTSMHNEAVGKVLLTSENDVFGGHLTLPKHEIVDCGAFYEVTFSASRPRIYLGTFSTASTT